MTALEMFKAGDKWRDQTTRLALPIVLRRAMDGEPITYGELNKAVIAGGGPQGMALTYRYTAGKIGDICIALCKDTGEDIPPINAIIISDRNRVPSHGVDYYLARFLGKPQRYIKSLSSDARAAYAREAMKRVFAFPDWLAVAKQLGIASNIPARKREDGEPIPPPDHKHFSTGPESQAHKDLKAWVTKNPSFFTKYGPFHSAATEQRLSSGDRLDVFFESKHRQLAVEVKAKDASEAEVQRGVYQCIKYRATLQAMQQAASKPPNAQAVLVLDRKPSATTKKLAYRLSVEIIVVIFEGK
jgi:hypothetical protein